MYPFHVALSGIDGAGKSTLADSLNYTLNSRGYKSMIAENNHLFSYFQMLRAAGTHDIRRHFGTDNVELVLTFEALRDYYYGVLPFKCENTVVISPRCYLDRIPKAMALGGKNVEMIEQLLDLCPPPELHFLLDLSVDEAMRRIERRNRDREDPALLERLRHAYLRVAKKYGMIVIDANLPVSELCDLVMNKINVYLKDKEPFVA